MSGPPTQLALTMYDFLSDAIVKNFPGWRPNLLFIVVTKRCVLPYVNWDLNPLGFQAPRSFLPDGQVSYSSSVIILY